MDSTRRSEERKEDTDLALKCLFALGILACTGLVLVSVVMVKTTYDRHQLVDRIAWSIAELEVTLAREEMARRESARNATGLRQ